MADPHNQPERGVKLLHDPVRNKGTAFTAAERDRLGLRGLLPPRIHTMEEQERRVLANLRSRANDLDRYLFLMDLQNRNETLFYRVVMNHIEETMPLIYTPTVGQACQAYGHIFRRPRGLYLTIEDRGQVAEVLRNWPHREARICVVTDGERILGLGDLGADGMGIPVGKLALYTACAGIHPTQCLPVTIDVGTDNVELLDDPLYIGMPHRRVRGAAYDELLDEFVDAVQAVFPGIVIQLEDFGNANAFRLLERYRERACVFDDDIQGTGAVAYAGVLGALRLTGKKLREQRILFLGAGEAGIGIAETVVAGLVARGVDEERARQCCWFVDTRGLLTRERAEIAAQKRPWAHEHAPLATLLEAVEALHPTVLIGTSGQPAQFTEPVVRAMARHNERPVIFALSNPTSRAECTAEQAYAWSGGRAVFASGSPFAPVTLGGRTQVPGQGNNAYIFPGVGLGLIVSRARRATDEMFLAAAESLAAQVTDEDLALGRVYPPLSRIREVSALIACEVATTAYRSGLADRPRPADPLADIRAQMYTPEYTACA
jgi:malate dehydrogenase (oxaloacetate-decarboxylating)(NADP+)